MLGRRSRTPPDHRPRCRSSARRSGRHASARRVGPLAIQPALHRRSSWTAVATGSLLPSLVAVVCVRWWGSRRPRSPEPGRASRAVVARTAERRSLDIRWPGCPAPGCATTSGSMPAQRPPTRSGGRAARLRRSFAQPGANAGRPAGRLSEGSTSAPRRTRPPASLQRFSSGGWDGGGHTSRIGSRLEDWGQRCRRQDGAGLQRRPCSRLRQR
jgi:hypothetical protein